MTDEEFLDNVVARIVAAKLGGSEFIAVSPIERRRLYNMAGDKYAVVDETAYNVGVHWIIGSLKKLGRTT